MASLFRHLSSPIGAEVKRLLPLLVGLLAGGVAGFVVYTERALQPVCAEAARDDGEVWGPELLGHWTLALKRFAK